MKLYNTLTRKVETFKPSNPPQVTFYSCGPTVYDYTHIGHMRTYTNNDLLKRTLNYLGYKVKHVMNITDVGHLTGDDDSGEDKIEKGAKKIGKTVWQVAEFYTDYFFKTINALNIIKPEIICKATDHILQMIEMIKKLEEKGYTYKTKEAIYFDVSKFKKYGQLSHQKLEEKIKGAREEVHIDNDKRNPADFSLWFFRVGRFANHTMHWPSFWGDGFPGWHIECSAMSSFYLETPIDIHSGGVDHIPIHHENEIAQSEACFGKTFVKYWFHNNFLTVDNQKMSKSLGNFYTLSDLKKKNIHPLAIRYLFLQSHYRQIQNFTWQAAQSASEAYQKLKNLVSQLKKSGDKQKGKLSPQAEDFKKKFKDYISDDLKIPQALALMWQMLKSNLARQEKLALIFDFDQVFGLKLDSIKKEKEEKIPQKIKKLADERFLAKQKKDFKKADEIREKIQKLGYLLIDEKEGYSIKKIRS